VYWFQGLRLQPQHFQLLDKSVDSRLDAYRRFSSPYFRGLVGMVLQESVLQSENFEPDSLEAVFDDGTHAVYPGNAVLAPRSFSNNWDEQGEGVVVFLGLKRFNRNVNNVDVVDDFKGLDETNERMAVTRNPEKVSDSYSEKGLEAEVRELKYVVRFFFGDEAERYSGYQLMPLALIRRDGDRLSLSERFVPPVMTIASSDVLFKLIRDIRDLLTAKAKQLEEYKQQRGVSKSEFGSRDMAYLLALISLSRYVPALHHYCDAETVPPWEVYGTLRSLVGELASFSLQYDCLGAHKDAGVSVQPYNHEDLWGCFDALRSVLVHLMDELTAGPEYVIQLLFDGEYFSAELPAKLFEGSKRFYLAVHSGKDEQDVGSSFNSEAKLSTRAYLAILIAKALPGISLKHLETPPQELPKRLGTRYYEIDRHGDQWTLVNRSGGVSLFWPNAPADLEVDIMVVER
jgi:type VI secretion system protein ImpJ